MSSFSRVFKSAWGRVAIVAAVGFAMIVGSMPASALTSISRSNYIVRVQPGTDAEVRGFLASMGDIPTDEIDYVFDGFIVKLADFEANALRANSNVIDVALDQTVSLLDTDSAPPSWGLDRIDQPALPLSNSFTYPAQGGQGVRVYIVDTGVQADNPDFAGRILPGFDVIGTNAQNTDCHGHGTHVAGTAAGTRYGIAKQASIVPVRVLSCAGSGSYSGIITALDWIKQNNPAGTPAVINMSIGGPTSAALNTAVESLVASGIVAAVAAGNSNTDACTASPASATSAITVAASNNSDARAYFSNYGTCVDIYAPGLSIVSDNAFAPGSSTTMSGTSMASPHVAGAAALVLGANPTYKPAQVLTALQDNGVKSVITNSLSTNDSLLNISFLNTVAPPAPVIGAPDAPTGVAVSAITQTGATVSWTAPVSDGGSPVTGYKVEYRASATSAWTSVDATTTTATLTGLTATTVYQVQVSAVNVAATSLPSAIVSFTSLGNVPGAPTNVRVPFDHGNSVRLEWTAPANGGNAITYYTAQVLLNGIWTTAMTNTSPMANVNRLTPLTDYSFKIWATNAAGPGVPVEFNYTTGPLAPATPTVTLADLTGKSVNVNWTASAQTDPNYPVSYEFTWGYATSLTPKATLILPAATTSYRLSLLPVTRYWVRVQALAGKSQSGANYVSFTSPADVPTAPFWNSTTKTTTSYTLNWGVSNVNGSPLLDYQLQSSATNTSTSTWTTVATVTAGTFTVPMPAAGQAVYYRVAARNAIGLSPYSTVTSVSGPVVAPTAPQNLVVTKVSNGVSLTWDAPANNGGAIVTSYILKVSTNNGNTWSNGPTVAANARATISYVWSLALGKGQTALFTVTATNSAGAGAPSAPVTLVVGKTVASSPTGLRATSDVATGKSVLSWSAPADNGGAAITGYLVQLRDSNGAWNTVAEVAPTATSLMVTLGAPGAVVAVQILAVNEIGQSVPSSAITVVVPFQKADAPQNVTAVVNTTANRVDLSWAAPSDTKGGTVSGYTIQISTNAGVSWINYTSANASVTTVGLPMPAKGVTYQYRLAAVTQGGVGAYSSPVSITRAVTAPSAPTTRSVVLANGTTPTIGWNAPSDNGGSVITGYTVEQLVAGTWTQVGSVAGNVTSFTGSAANPGQSLQFRVYAVNAIGTSPASSVFSISTPLLKPAAPTGATLTETTGATTLTVAWTAPTDFGGASAPTRYAVEVSSNGGTTWSTYSAAPTATSYVLNKPGKGLTYTVRVRTVTGYGLSDPSNSVTYSVAATAPSAPYGVRVSFGTDGNPIFAWYAPTDIGGSPITGYSVELGASAAGSTTPAWSTPIAVAGNGLNVVGTRGAPGSYHFVRVTAINAIGSSPVSAVGALMVPLLKPSAPQQLTAVQATAGSTSVTLSWQTPANLGGATAVSYYLIDRSLDGGATWTQVTSSSATRVVIGGPAKGTSAQYRVTPRTGYGNGDSAVSAVVTSAATIPSTPTAVTAALSTDGSNTVTLSWMPPSDAGGVALTGYRVERNEVSSTGWSVIGTTDANTRTLQVPFSAAGSYAGYRVFAINQIGVSTQAYAISIRMPFAAPAASGTPVVTTATNSTTATPRILVTWAASSNLGGAGLSYYSLQASTDGVTWAVVANTTATNWYATKPATGTRVQYRVVVFATSGLSNVSGVTTVSY